MPNNLTLSNAKLVSILQALIVYSFVFNPWTSFPYTFIIIIISILVLVYWTDKTFAKIGFILSHSILKTIGIALTIFLITSPILDFIIQPLVNKVTGDTVDFSAFQALAHNFKLYSKYALFVLISAAFGEEILFRGFLFRQLNIILPEFKFKTQTMVFVSAILFSIPHWYQGLSGLIMTFIFGILFATVYVKFKYNLWVTIILHGLIDTLFLTLAYYEKLDYYVLGNDFLFGY
ncbi:CPBP family intramembrane glutamic endopeptidase [Tenacibaculum xiamenense]|uniref:CPBP family intramembrane glutamic endopeptidase n=1 Tax=Tenacibaculum xiamenense TaxID=1261553 RepID=UPI0038934B03